MVEQAFCPCIRGAWAGTQELQLQLCTWAGLCVVVWGRGTDYKALVGMWPACAALPGFYLRLLPRYGFPGGSVGEESACNAGHLGSIPGSGRSPGEGNGYPVQYSCLENSTDRGTWWTTAHGVARIWTGLSNPHFHFLTSMTVYKNFQSIALTFKNFLFQNLLTILFSLNWSLHSVKHSCFKCKNLGVLKKANTWVTPMHIKTT